MMMVGKEKNRNNKCCLPRRCDTEDLEEDLEAKWWVSTHRVNVANHKKYVNMVTNLELTASNSFRSNKHRLIYYAK